MIYIIHTTIIKKTANYYLIIVSRNLILAGSGKKERLHLGFQCVILRQGKTKNTINAAENMYVLFTLKLTENSLKTSVSKSLSMFH